MLGISLNDQGILLSHAGKMAEAEVYLRKALALRQKLTADNPGVKSHRDRLAETHLCLAIVMSGTARPAEAEAEDRAALAIYQKLVDENPAVTKFREKVAATHSSLAMLLANTGRPAAEAEVDYQSRSRSTGSWLTSTRQSQPSAVPWPAASTAWRC